MYPIPLVPAQEHDDLARSALPDAPVVPHRDRRLWRATRVALAAALHATARAVEPAPRRRPEVCA